MLKYEQVKRNPKIVLRLAWHQNCLRATMKATGYQTDMETPKYLTDTHWRGQQVTIRTEAKTEEPIHFSSK